MNVMMKHNFSISSILCEKCPFASNANIARINPITITGAIRVECRTVVKRPTTITPAATNAVK